MEQMFKQMTTKNTEPKSRTKKRIVGIFFGVIEVILAFRLFFKLLGANVGNDFVHSIYAVTQFFVGIFEGIFSAENYSGDKIASVLEPSTLIAMVVIALIAWVVMMLMTPRIDNQVETVQYTEHEN